MPYDYRHADRRETDAGLIRLAHRLLCRLIVDGPQADYTYTRRGRLYTVYDYDRVEVFSLTPRLVDKGSEYHVHLTGDIPHILRFFKMVDEVDPLRPPKGDKPRSVMARLPRVEPVRQ